MLWKVGSIFKCFKLQKIRHGEIFYGKLGDEKRIEWQINTKNHPKIINFPSASPLKWWIDPHPLPHPHHRAPYLKKKNNWLKLNEENERRVEKIEKETQDNFVMGLLLT